MWRRARALVALVLVALLGGGAERGEAGCSPSSTIGDHAPVWSPTGDWIVFDRHDVGCFYPKFLTSVRPDGTSETRLPSFSRRVEWLRDGSAMIGNGFALVAPDGRVLRPPLPVSSPAGVTTPSLSPDGSRVVFDGSGFPLQLVVADADGANPRSITDDRRTAPASPVWSPRGDLIAFEVPGGVDVVRPDGTGRRSLWRGARYPGGVSWSPDGTRLAFTLERAVHIVGVDSGEGRDVVAGRRLPGYPPTWHPDGSRIAVTRSAGPAGEIVVVRSDGRGERIFGPGADLRWSPDGARVAYVWHGRCPPTRLGVYVANADGTGPRRLTNDCRFEGGPGNDVLRGTADDDFLYGRAGDDLLVDGYGDDVLEGGDGDDRLRGGEEFDLVSGGRGDDVLAGGGGRDRIYGGPGRDRINAGIARDSIFVADGERDVVACGSELDLVVADRRDRIARDCERVVRR